MTYFEDVSWALCLLTDAVEAADSVWVAEVRWNMAPCLTQKVRSMAFSPEL
ncbi:MAG: hypothetical protein OXH72_15180 [Caldilineaceae bacterium]|nr:hypothetical protein [Caldilineaceae bacterium]